MHASVLFSASIASGASSSSHLIHMLCAGKGWRNPVFQKRNRKWDPKRGDKLRANYCESGIPWPHVQLGCPLRAGGVARKQEEFLVWIVMGLFPANI